MNTMGQNLLDKTVVGLAKAYMFLYKKLVAAYQSDGKSVRQSKLNAICMMGVVLAEYNTDCKSPAGKFLSELYNTHRGIISPDQNYLEPISEKSMVVVALAIAHLEDAILAAYAQYLPKLYQLPPSSIPIVENYEVPNSIFPARSGRPTCPVNIRKPRNAPRYRWPLYTIYACRKMCR